MYWVWKNKNENSSPEFKPVLVEVDSLIIVVVKQVTSPNSLAAPTIISPSPTPMSHIIATVLSNPDVHKISPPLLPILIHFADLRKSYTEIFDPPLLQWDQ